MTRVIVWKLLTNVRQENCQECKLISAEEKFGLLGCKPGSEGQQLMIMNWEVSNAGLRVETN